ncbi:udkA, partial [Symbiodinium necroappetens]
MGSSSDLCGSITEGDESAGSPWEGPTEDAFHVQLERESKAEDWGFVWNQTALSTRRRFLLESVSEGSPAASWNSREWELGRSTLEPGSTLVEANYLAGYGVIRHELRESMQLRLTFLRPAPDPTPTEKRLVGLPLECRVKNSFLEVSPVDADSQEEARHFSDPGPCAQKGCSSSAEGAGVSATEPQICGYHTESEAVSDLIGTAALISGLVRSAEFNGKWCRIDAFDPEVRRYIVRVFLEEGQPPVIAKLRLENLSFGPTFALASSATPVFHPFAPPGAAVAEDLSAWPWGQANWPWGIHAGMTGAMEGCMPVGMEADAWQVPAEWASYPFGPPGLPPTEAAVMQSMPPPPPATPLCILPTTEHFATSDAAAAPNTAGMAENAGESHERPPQIHTHQVLEQQLIQQHLQVLQQSAAPDVQEAVQPSVSSSHQPHSASSLHQEAEEPQAPHEEDVAEGKRKRRRRRRGKRKGRGSKDAQDAEDDDEESDVAEEPSLGNEADVLTSQSRHASTPQPTEAEVQVQQHAAAETLQAAVPGSPRLEALQTLSTRKPEELFQEDAQFLRTFAMASGKEELLSIFRAFDTKKNGLVSQPLVHKLLLKAGFVKEHVDQLWEVAGFVAKDFVPYASLVDWLWAAELNKAPPAGPGTLMEPVELAQAPPDGRAEVALQSLMMLIAAASWAEYGPEKGEVCVESVPSTPEAFMTFSVAYAKDKSLSLSASLASLLTQKVRLLIKNASLGLEVVDYAKALLLLKAQGFSGCHALAESLVGAAAIGLHAVHLKGESSGARQVFRTPAVSPCALPGSLAGVPWEIQVAEKAGHFKLLGPKVDLSALVPGEFGKLGDPLPMSVGVKECNEAAKAKEQTHVALQAETMQNNFLGELSDRIATAAKEKSCVVVVAGPSSSGKTTFSARLALHLQARGCDARPLECDMYFKARADPSHPRDAKGELNFEDPDSLRIDKIKQDLEALMTGNPVELPKFCFKTGTIQEKTGNILKLPKSAVLIIEGIFGLHPKFLAAFEDVSLFKVLIGPWSGSRLGNLCLVPERKFRLLRRIGRDVRSRGVDAVSAGEQLNIFPYAGKADVIFDSTLHYELPALKAVIGADVENATSDDPVVQWRKRELANYLSWAEAWPVSEYELLPTSIACEFLGSSIFESWKPRLEGTACPGEVQPSPTPPAVLLTGELREGGRTSSRDASSEMQEIPEVAVAPGANDALQPASRAKTR